MDFFYIFAQAVLTSTHNVCIGSKIRKIGLPPVNPRFAIYIVKVGYKGVYIARTCFPGEEVIHFTDMLS